MCWYMLSPAESNGGGLAVSFSCGTALPRRQMAFNRKTLSARGIGGHCNQCFRGDDEHDDQNAAESKKA